MPGRGVTRGPAPPAPPSPRLERRLGTGDAVVIGLGAMLGAGVFAAIGPAASAAGGGLLLGLAAAAVVAYCNATSSAQLAAIYPESGGTYVYGRERLGAFWGYLAGWGFVVGKTASCAAMALTFGAYAWPDAPRPPAIAAVVAVTALNLRGIQRTARTTRVIVAIVLAALAAAVAAALFGGHASVARLDLGSSSGPYGILQAGGLFFFAFAGYARIATLGEEVREPARTIPRAIPLALTITLAVYVTVALSAQLALGPGRLAHATAPLADAARAGTLAWLAPAVRVGAAVASFGVLLSLLAGVSRTTLAMARDRELPGWLDAVHPRHHVPHHAEPAVAAVVIAAVLAADLRAAIGFSSFTVLTYYAIANASAWTLAGDQRRWPRPLAALGVAGCAALALTLPLGAAIAGAATLAAGAAIWAARHRRGSG
jgi:basic amino acid/polyamine antiporter, APA family